MSDRRAANAPRSFPTLRTLVFWPHLLAGVSAGVLILLMSVTGVLLTYERQFVAWSDRAYRSMPSAGATRLPLGILLQRIHEARPDLAPMAVTMAAAREAPVMLTVGQRAVYADAYSGQVLGEGSQTVRRAMNEIRSWHRWLSVEGDGRFWPGSSQGGLTSCSCSSSHRVSTCGFHEKGLGSTSGPAHSSTADSGARRVTSTGTT